MVYSTICCIAFNLNFLDEERQLMQLEKEMNMAIADQQFEKCAALRDQIQRLRDQQSFMLDPMKIEDARKKLNESLNQAIENQRFELCVEIRDKTAVSSNAISTAFA